MLVLNLTHTLKSRRFSSNLTTQKYHNMDHLYMLYKYETMFFLELHLLKMMICIPRTFFVHPFRSWLCYSLACIILSCIIRLWCHKAFIHVISKPGQVAILSDKPRHKTPSYLYDYHCSLAQLSLASLSI